MQDAGGAEADVGRGVLDGVGDRAVAALGFGQRGFAADFGVLDVAAVGDGRVRRECRLRILRGRLGLLFFLFLLVARLRL